MTNDQDEVCTCWLCHDGVPDELVELVKVSAAQQERAMKINEFREWLAALEPDIGPVTDEA